MGRFQDILKAEGFRPKKRAVAAPNTNAFVQRFIQTIQQRRCSRHLALATGFPPRRVFDDEERPAAVRGAGVEDAGNVGVVQEGRIPSCRRRHDLLLNVPRTCHKRPWLIIHARTGTWPPMHKPRTTRPKTCIGLTACLFLALWSKGSISDAAESAPTAASGTPSTSAEPLRLQTDPIAEDEPISPSPGHVRPSESQFFTDGYGPVPGEAPNLTTMTQEGRFSLSESLSGRTGFKPGYYDPDVGFVVLEPEDPEAAPFQLNFRLYGQGRYTGFARSQNTWTQSNGEISPVLNQSNIELNRMWFAMSGYGFDPKLVYSFIAYPSTASGSVYFLGWGGYKFDASFNLYIGYYKVPGTREWLTRWYFAEGSDRSMATTFFRPNYSPGIWANGALTDSFHYYLFIGDAFAGNTSDFVQGRVNTNMVYSANVWWEPLGEYGESMNDLKAHDHWVMRTGSSSTYHRHVREPGDISNATGTVNNPDATVFRLSDGTPLNAVGALGPGVLLNAETVYLLSLDMGFKYRGFSIYNEYMLRWLGNFQTSGGPPTVNALFDWGSVLQTGYFLTPETVELFTRGSFVRGQFGTGWEAGGGVAWFPKRNSHLRCSLEVLRILRAPAQSPTTPYLAGESGTAILGQFQFVF